MFSAIELSFQSERDPVIRKAYAKYVLKPQSERIVS
mgnify:CR=1 FL=1